jgi:membrane protease YdiL (CAAX protease family)
MDSRTKARRGLAIFFVVLIAGTAYFEHKIFVLGGDIGQHINLIYGLMWWVTVASVVARLIMRESPRDISFRWGGWAGTRAILVATALPLIVGLVAYGIAWGTGLAKFDPPNPSHPFLGIGLGGAPLVRLMKRLLVLFTVGGVLSCKSAAGEEIGWRGYMLTRLVATGIPAPILASGIIWGLWHTPLILSGQYASGPHPVLSACLFVIDVAAAAFTFGWLRISSRSIWPAIWAHGVWNAVIQGGFDASTAGYSVWVGESGIFTSIMTVLFAVILYRLWPITDEIRMIRVKGAEAG